MSYFILDPPQPPPRSGCGASLHWSLVAPGLSFPRSHDLLPALAVSPLDQYRPVIIVVASVRVPESVRFVSKPSQVAYRLPQLGKRDVEHRDGEPALRRVGLLVGRPRSDAVKCSDHPTTFSLV